MNGGIGGQSYYPNAYRIVNGLNGNVNFPGDSGLFQWRNYTGIVYGGIGGTFGQPGKWSGGSPTSDPQFGQPGDAGNSVVTNNFYLCLRGNTPDRVKGSILGTYDTSCDTLAPTSSLTANPSTVNYNGSSTLSWTSTNANSCSAPSWTTSTSTSGSKILSSLKLTKNYSISCAGDGGIASATTTITVNPPVVPPPPPKPTFTIQPTTAYNTGCGAKVNLSWTATANTDRYQIFKATTTDIDSNFNGIDSVTTTSYVDTSVINGNTYYYRIKSCNVLNECSGYSSSTSAVVIPPASDCNDPSTITSKTSTSTCYATQGVPPTNKIYINKQMTWNIVGSPVAIPNYATTTWSGTNITGTISNIGSIYNKIYTTVGLKNINIISRWKEGSINYTASCSTTTNVLLEEGDYREI